MGGTCSTQRNNEGSGCSGSGTVLPTTESGATAATCQAVFADAPSSALVTPRVPSEPIRRALATAPVPRHCVAKQRRGQRPGRPPVCRHCARCPLPTRVSAPPPPAASSTYQFDAAWLCTKYNTGGRTAAAAAAAALQQTGVPGAGGAWRSAGARRLHRGRRLHPAHSAGPRPPCAGFFFAQYTCADNSSTLDLSLPVRVGRRGCCCCT